MRNAYNKLVGKPEGRDHSEDLGVNGKITLGMYLTEIDGKMWIGCTWLRAGTSNWVM
jgi:hypothetical protein